MLNVFKCLVNGEKDQKQNVICLYWTHSIKTELNYLRRLCVVDKMLWGSCCFTISHHTMKHTYIKISACQQFG